MIPLIIVIPEKGVWIVLVFADVMSNRNLLRQQLLLHFQIFT
jgi:hypothetical protein